MKYICVKKNCEIIFFIIYLLKLKYAKKRIAIIINNILSVILNYSNILYCLEFRYTYLL